MEIHDARIIRGAAIPTAVVGAAAMLVSFLLAGGHGALGALIGLGVVTVFFTIGLVAVGYASRVSAAVMMQVALVTYLVKIVALAALVIAFRDTTAFDLVAFASTVIACTLVWTTAQMRAFTRQQIPYVDPDRGR